MKTKILAIFLLICILIPCFAVFSSAEGDIYDNVDQNPFYNRTWKQASNGEYYNVNFDKYIDVEQYIKNAPDERRESFDIVGIEEYWGNGDDKCLVLYVYNPSNAQIPTNEPYGVTTAISGTVTFSFEYDEIAYVTPELHDDDKSAQNMFVRFIVHGEFSVCVC